MTTDRPCSEAPVPSSSGAARDAPGSVHEAADDGRARMVLLVVGLGTFLSAGSASTVNLALPDISQELSAAIDVVGWVLAAYLLAVTVLLLVAGRVGDLLGHRRVYLLGFALFGVASAACGLTGSIATLIAGRVVQGVGGAMVAATGPALLTTSFHPSKRGRALGMLATATYTGLTFGPPIGGWLVSLASWRWVFFANLPIAVLVVALGVAYLPRRQGAAEVRFDWMGTASLSFGLPLVLVAVAQGQRWGWGSTPVLASGLGGLALLVVFVFVEVRAPSPLLDLDLFRSRVFTGATVSAMGNYVALFISIILLPFFLIEGRGFDASHAGMLLSAQPLVMALVASPSGRLSDRIGSRGLATGGLIVLALGLGGLSTVGETTPITVIAAWLAIMGLGTGVFISPNSSALMGAAPRQQQGTAGGVMAVARNLGMIVGVAAATTLFVAAGGSTGERWEVADFDAYSLALRVASAVCLMSALGAALRGPRRALSTIEP